MNIAWGITGAGHFLRQSIEVFETLKKTTPHLKITILISRAGEEVVKMYGLENKLHDISKGEYLEEIFPESKQGASFPKTGRFLLQRYHALIICPATSNTTAKIAHGIADTLVTNAVAQSIKGDVPVFIVPVDISGKIESRMPYFIDRDICMKCEICPPQEHCHNKAIAEQIDLLRCDGCGECVKLCSFGAIKGGVVKLKVRDVDSNNVRILHKLEGITVLDNPQAILRVIEKLNMRVTNNKWR